MPSGFSAGLILRPFTLHDAKKGLNVAVVEAHRAGFGASGRNGGQLGSGQRKGQEELETMLGMEHARQLWALAEESKATAKALIEEHRIQCDLKPGILHPTHKASYVDEAHRHADKLRGDYGYQDVVDNEFAEGDVGLGQAPVEECIPFVR